MKFGLLLLGLLFLAPLSAQNYYVAIVKGEVYYNNKRIKKRDKINIKHTIRFTSASDYLKLSGPGGLYTLRATSQAAKKQGSEFWLSIKAEVYPRVTERPTTSSNFSLVENGIDTAYFRLDDGYTTGFCWEEKALGLREDVPMDNIWAVMDTDAGLVTEPLSVVNNAITLDLKRWMPGKRDHEGSRKLQRVVFMQINDPDKWESTRAQLKSSEDLWQHYPHFDHSASLEEETTPTATVETPAGLILDNFSPVVYNRKAVRKELKRLVKQSGATTPKEFMHDLYYDDYIDDTYGYNNHYIILPILESLMGVTSSID